MNDVIVKETSNDVVKRFDQIEFTKEQVELIKSTVMHNASNDELKLFLYVAKKTGLDPLTKQIYAVARWDKKQGRNVFTFQTGIDGFRVVAERSNLYAGQVGPFWCGADGAWQDVWLKKEPPLASKVGVIRKDFKETLFAVANWDSYVQKDKEGKLTQFWRNMAPLMLAKVAEALALRKAFPQDLSGLYTSEEMAQAEPQNEPVKIKESNNDVKVESPKAVAVESVNSLLINQIKEELKIICADYTQEMKIKFLNDLGLKSFNDLFNYNKANLEILLKELIDFKIELININSSINPEIEPIDVSAIELPNVDEFIKQEIKTETQQSFVENKSKTIKEPKKSVKDISFKLG